ncbi:hypothetical protein ACHAXR_003096 [Thalassiosira sp. AJA248-18]
MGGGNAQKSAAARLKNLKDAGKTPEQRAATSAKAAADAQHFKCKICMTTFMVNVKPPTLYLHMTSKHKDMTDPGLCFESMKGYDPEDPTGEKAAAAAAKNKPVVKKKAKKPEASLDDLLNAGLSTGKKKKGKK